MLREPGVLQLNLHHLPSVILQSPLRLQPGHQPHLIQLLLWKAARCHQFPSSFPEPAPLTTWIPTQFTEAKHLWQLIPGIEILRPTWFTVALPPTFLLHLLPFPAHHTTIIGISDSKPRLDSTFLCLLNNITGANAYSIPLLRDQSSCRVIPWVDLPHLNFLLSLSGLL